MIYKYFMKISGSIVPLLFENEKSYDFSPDIEPNFITIVIFISKEYTRYIQALGLKISD